MTDIFVEDGNTAQGISNASFDHPSSSGGGGFYNVSMGSDIILTTSAPGYESAQTNLSIVQVVALFPRDSGGGGSSCF